MLSIEVMALLQRLATESARIGALPREAERAYESRRLFTALTEREKQMLRESWAEVCRMSGGEPDLAPEVRAAVEAAIPGLLQPLKVN